MPRREHPAFLDALEDEDQENTGKPELPEVRTPRRHVILTDQVGQGWWAKLFDKKRRLREQEDFTRCETEEKTITELYKIQAETSVKKARVHQDAKLKDYQHKAGQWVKITALKNQGVASVAKHKDLIELLERVAQLDLDPHHREHVVTEIVDLYLSRNGKRHDDNED